MLSNWRIGDTIRTPTGRRATVREFRTAEDGVPRMRIVYSEPDRHGPDTWIPVHLPRMTLDNKRG